MSISIKSKGEERALEAQKRTLKALKEREKARDERRQLTAKLRALRLAKEAEEAQVAERGKVEKSSTSDR